MNELFLVFANNIVALVICIVIGYVCRRKHMLNDTHTAGISSLLVNVAMPASMFMSLMRPFSTELLLESAATFFIVSIIFLLGGVAGLALARLLKASTSETPCWQFGVAFGNVGFMGIPIVSAVFGYEGLFYVATTLASFHMITFTIGVRMFGVRDMGGPLKIILRNPALMATFIGFGFFVSGLRLPAALEGGVSLIAGMTSPISMIIIGTILARQRLRETLTNFKVLPPVGMRLLFIPLLSLLVLRWFVSNPLMLGVIVTLMAMPPAAATVIFAEQFDGDAVAAAQIVVVGTLLCIITVPAISLLL